MKNSLIQHRLATFCVLSALLIACILLSMPGAARAQDSGQSAVPGPAVHSAVQKMGSVGEQEALPSSAAPPVSSVVDPGVIPSRQAITPAGLQSIFESRVYGIAFDENGDSIYAAVLGRKGTYVYRIDLKTNRMMTVLSAAITSGMQGLAYDPAGRVPLLAGLAGNGKRAESSGQLVALGGERES